MWITLAAKLLRGCESPLLRGKYTPCWCLCLLDTFGKWNTVSLVISVRLCEPDACADVVGLRSILLAEHTFFFKYQQTWTRLTVSAVAATCWCMVVMTVHHPQVCSVILLLTQCCCRFFPTVSVSVGLSLARTHRSEEEHTRMRSPEYCSSLRTAMPGLCSYFSSVIASFSQIKAAN